MPREPNFLGETVTPITMSEDSESNLRTGRQIYEFVSRTALNRSSISDLQSFILAGVQADPVAKIPFPIEDTSERLLVDGSLAYNIENGEWINDITSMKLKRMKEGGESKDIDALPELESGIFTTLVRDKIKGEPRHKFRLLYELENELWTITLQKFEDGKWMRANQSDAEDGEITVDASKDQIFAFENGRGLLYWAQRVFFRLEEIQSTTKFMTEKDMLQRIIFGYVGDKDKAKAALTGPDPNIFMPGGVRVQTATGSAVIDSLLTQSDKLENFWRKAMKDTIAADDSAESGVARRLKMMPMLQFIRVTRRQLELIYGSFNVKLTFDKVRVQTIDERAAEYNLLKQMRADGVIKDDEFERAAKDLA